MPSVSLGPGRSARGRSVGGAFKTRRYVVEKFCGKLVENSKGFQWIWMIRGDLADLHQILVRGNELLEWHVN